MAAKTVTVTEIRRILAGEGNEPLTEMAISKFVSDGMPKEARGRYNPDLCVYWYIGRLRRTVQQNSKEDKDGNIRSLDEEQTRLVSAKASQEELNLAERMGLLIPVQVYEQQIATFANTTKMALLNLPARLAGKLEGLTRTESKALIGAAVRGCLAEIAHNARAKPNRDAGASDSAVPVQGGRRPKRKPAKQSRRSKR